VDHGGWKLLREAVRVLAAQHTGEGPTGHPQRRLVVLPPGALARDGAARDAPRTAKLRTGTILLSMGEEQTLNDGTQRIRVTWSVADESCEGWISSKNCALLAAPPVIEEQAPPRTPPRRLTTWLDRAAAASTGNPARARPDALLLEGNARFLGRFPPERQQYLATKLERVLRARTPSRESLSGLSPEGSPRPKADWTLRRRLRFYGRRLADDSLSDAQIRRLREGLLGEYGAAWRRDREKDVATCLAKAATDLRDGAMGELWRPAGRATSGPSCRPLISRPRQRRPPCIWCRRGFVPRCRRGVFSCRSACGRGASGRAGMWNCSTWFCTARIARRRGPVGRRRRRRRRRL